MATVLEPIRAREPDPRGSDRSFGFVFAVLFFIIGCWPLLHSETPRWWSLGLAFAFAALAVLWPRALRGLNRVWLAFGHLLHRVVSPLIMGAIFFICVTPIALIMRLLGKDVLSLKRQPELTTYWISVPPSLPADETMKRQF